jgi:low affinity Fe/Cu permease
MRDLFRKFSRACADAVGSPWAFLVAVSVCALWALTGPIYGYSDTWQLVINTATTVVTFLMVFLIQNTQNRDAKAIHLKLDELLRGVKGARTGLVHLEDLSDQELEALTKEFERLQHRAAERLRRQRGEAAPDAEQRAGKAEQPAGKKDAA